MERIPQHYNAYQCGGRTLLEKMADVKRKKESELQRRLNHFFDLGTEDLRGTMGDR